VPAELLMGGSAGALVLAESQLPIVPPIYRSLFDLTVERYGDRALELILPATALALRYTVRTTLISNWLPPSRKTGAVIRSRARALNRNLRRSPKRVPSSGRRRTCISRQRPSPSTTVFCAICPMESGGWTHTPAGESAGDASLTEFSDRRGHEGGYLWIPANSTCA
jgi:hypothetical protein